MGYMHLYELIAFGTNCVLFFVGMVFMSVFIMNGDYLLALVTIMLLFLVGYVNIQMVARWIK